MGKVSVVLNHPPFYGKGAFFFLGLAAKFLARVVLCTLPPFVVIWLWSLFRFFFFPDCTPCPLCPPDDTSFSFRALWDDRPAQHFNKGIQPSLGRVPRHSFLVPGEAPGSMTPPPVYGIGPSVFLGVTGITPLAQATSRFVEVAEEPVLLPLSSFGVQPPALRWLHHPGLSA